MEARGVLAALLSLAALGAPASAQTPGGPSCSTCGDRGVAACRACAKTACKSARPFLFCTEAMKCKSCGGTRLEACGLCARAPEVDLAAVRVQTAAWRDTVKPVDAFMDRALMHAESLHFTLTFDVKKIDTPGAGNAHAAAHVYLDRMEDLFAAFCADLGCGEPDFLAKTHVMLWGREADQEKASPRFTLQQSSTESKLMGAKPVVSIFYDKNHMHEEYELHQAVVHQVAHCLLSNVYDGIWPGNIHGGWIDEGVAHYYENALFGEVRHYCYVESDSIGYFKFGRWEPEVRSAVETNKALAFLGVTGVNTVEMTPPQRMFAWSFCDFVIRGTPGKLGPLARAIKQKRPLQEALSVSLGVTPFEFEKRWREWVLATYSAKKR
jgi:hypothetical protein